MNLRTANKKRKRRLLGDHLRELSLRPTYQVKLGWKEYYADLRARLGLKL